ncbi:hypothetical protein KX816_08930 [Sphingosinicellaceae bacterium]|nr:hypothetical protein KX816_08930 [Sphingosinicellaceae bacterium]
MTDARLVVFAGLGDGFLPSRLFAADNLETESFASAAELRGILADRYDIALIVIDLSVADAALLDLLQGPSAPRAVFLVGRGDDARITLSPNVVGYVDAATSMSALRDAVLDALPRSARIAVGDFSDRDAQRLNSLGREVERIARALTDLAAASQLEASAASPVDAAQVREVIKRRRDRERFFPAELFSDPAWDMLLDLTAARLEHRLVSVSSLCIAAAVPTSTALRWIRNLCDVGMFERNIDPDDLRRGLISLGAPTADRMFAYLARRGAAAA